jgi:hypothetical protein
MLTVPSPHPVLRPARSLDIRDQRGLFVGDNYGEVEGWSDEEDLALFARRPGNREDDGHPGGAGRPHPILRGRYLP